MAQIVALFADGRLLVQEEKAVETNYAAAQGVGVAVRIGLLKTVERVLSIDAYLSGFAGASGNFYVALGEAQRNVSGNTINVVLRRADQPGYLTSAFLSLSGMPAMGGFSGFTSGIPFMGEIASGSVISGLVRILANVIGL